MGGSQGARMPGLVSLVSLLALAACGGGGPAPPSASAPPDPAPAKAYLAEVGREPGVVTLKSGLEYRVLQSGLATGASPQASDRVLVNYEARLPTGELIDSSYARGAPDTFQVDAVVKAWTEALQLMKPGDVWMLYAPPGLAYGDAGAGPIPPGSALVFKVELIRVLPPGGPAAGAGGSG
jgi:peptidylprolyl isomerase/FKBP-type peptidyl-prolyl cis-trans isomerase FklB